ncbi:MAG: MBOAT family protein [Planctomycetes bacterium]|nr:MBOAT family protein [Planctomycetota bacterium]
MIFASFVFLQWFLGLFLLVYAFLPPRARNVWLTVASFLFYAWWRPQYVFLMFGSTLIDFWCAKAMGAVDSGRRRRFWLWFSVATNLGLLGYFKYVNLAVATWQDLTGAEFVWERVLLPVGISFYTFQSMSYTIDVYRGQVQPVRSLPDLMCYVSMFPQLVAGPIVRYRDVQEQIHDRRHSLLWFSSGVFLFGLGLAKKVLIADRVAPLADQAFGLAAPGLIEAWTGVVAYSLQIYFDFSGYSDMAIGLGWMLGFRFPSNFLSPYRAHSITEFWRRWHVSLSTWLRDYLYVPLGGNRHGPLRTYVNLMLTMLLGGLWHGAQWTFVLWGLWQGVWLALERRLGKVAPYGWLPAPLQVLATFVLVLLGWVIFRASTVDNLLAMWSGMAGANGVGAAIALPYLTGWAYAMGGVGLLVAFALPTAERAVRRFHPLAMLGALLLFLWAIAHLLASNYSPFLYWQF